MTSHSVRNIQATGASQRGSSAWRRALSLFLALAIVLAMAGVVIPVAGCGTTTSFPVTAAQLDAARRKANGYLTDEGIELTAGRTSGATVYSLRVRLDTAGKVLSGDERVLYTNRSADPLTEVVFRVYAGDVAARGGGNPVTFDDVEADGRPVTHSLKGSILHVPLPSPLAPGKKAYLSFGFREPVPSTETSDGIFAYEGGTFDLGNFAPTVVTYSNGAWDNRSVPSYGDIMFYDCSYYYVSFEAPEDFVVATTGIETGSDGDRRIYSAGPVRDFEIQASDSYRSVSRQVGQTTVTSYYTGDQPVTGKAALDYGCTAFQLFSEHFGPYPYTRLNVCEAPLDDDGMEYTGQVQIASSLYGDPEDLGDLEYTIAHEVCHQWWALGVGSDSIDRAWQDESLTSFSETLYALWRYGDAAAQTYLQDYFVDGYLSSRQEGVPDGVVDQPMAGFEDGDQYTMLVYLKGALFFDSLENTTGDKAFEKSLAEYYRKNLFLNAPPQDMVSIFSSNASDPAGVNALFERWMHGVYGDTDIKAQEN